VTSEATRVCEWSRLKSSFFQPECITVVLWWLADEFVVRFALRLVCVMTLSAINIAVFVVWEKDAKL
jgi:hypothetical protein